MKSIFFEKYGEKVLIEPWGLNCVRVRATKNNDFSDKLSALIEPEEIDVKIEIDGNKKILINGNLRTEITDGGVISHFNSKTGKKLLSEPYKHVAFPTINFPAREYKTLKSRLHKICLRFESNKNERIFGLGQHQHGLMNQKGCVIELMQRNTEVTIPFLVSDQGYGFLWNNPAIGRVELANNLTRWIAEETEQIDYLVVAGDSYAEILECYSKATGFAPEMPEWALGFWQSKLRYRSQDELVNTAKEYIKRGLPLSVIVIDFFHWKHMGDWDFDPENWYDPVKLTKELEEIGVKAMISIWPSLNQLSNNYLPMKESGLLLENTTGVPVHFEFIDSDPKGPVYITYYDPTNPKAKEYIWNQVEKNYYNKGIKIWWLDSCEPDIYPAHFENLKYHLGSGLEVGCMYPFHHQQAFFNGMKKNGEKDVVLITRSAWAGSQRFGTAVWSGDIESSFEILELQVAAGLNMAMSGLPWWNTDIGGFHSGYPHTPYFRELIVRWFQYALFTPIFRLHGCRLPFDKTYETGSPNEVWSFGDEAYEIITKYLKIREKLKPYLSSCFKITHEKGLPVMRPLFFDYSNDDETYKIDDQFLCGGELLIAPILKEKQTERKVYLPKGKKWINVWSGEEFNGGEYITVTAPIEQIPVFTTNAELCGLFK